MEPLLVFPDAEGDGLGEVLARHDYPYRVVHTGAEVDTAEPEGGWSGAIVSTVGGREAAFALCKLVRHREPEPPLEPLVLVVRPDEVDALDVREDLFDEFVVASQVVTEIAARLRHRFYLTGRGTNPDLVEYDGLVLNLETYQAAVEGRALDLTYMEYELLKHFATHPGKVFTREVLLSRVWGYDYYGGARTVDVHVRRLRAKLGEEYAGHISTVRSVGYRFGRPSRLGA
ncbi:MAG: response regulator transcription factor [Acidimicrobiia bacterium]